jgi:hypothetical protein
VHYVNMGVLNNTNAVSSNGNILSSRMADFINGTDGTFNGYSVVETIDGDSSYSGFYSYVLFLFLHFFSSTFNFSIEYTR